MFDGQVVAYSIQLGVIITAAVERRWKTYRMRYNYEAEKAQSRFKHDGSSCANGKGLGQVWVGVEG